MERKARAVAKGVQLMEGLCRVVAVDNFYRWAGNFITEATVLKK